MMLAPALLACAGNVHPVTLQKVVDVEHGAPLALHVNRYSGRQPTPSTTEAALSVVRQFLAAGYSVDLGLMQLNTATVAQLGKQIEDVIGTDEKTICENIRLGGLVLGAGYGRAVSKVGEGQQALLMALSEYNTGSLTKGFTNGYVARYIPNVAIAWDKPDNPYTARTQVYARERVNIVIR